MIKNFMLIFLCISPTPALGKQPMKHTFNGLL